MRNYTQAVVILILTSLLFLFGCKKDDDGSSIDPSNQLGVIEIKGSIKLPSNSTLDINTLSILSPVAQSTIENGDYKIKTIENEFTTQVVINPAKQIVLMGYNYPKQSDFTINAQSTVLAMIMNSPAVYSLSSAGKEKTINDILTDPAFAGAVQEVERRIQSNANLLATDTSNSILAVRLNSLFTNVSNKRLQAKQPVQIQRAGREIMFQNPGVNHASVVGIYKDGNKVEQLTIGASKFFPASLMDIYDQLGAGTDPIEVPYSMKGDGNFTFKIRTGKPGSGSSNEIDEAFHENLYNGCLMVLEGLIPQLKNKSASCYGSIALRIRNKVNAVTNTSGNPSASEIGRLVVNIGISVVDDIQGLLECFAKAEDKSAVGSFLGAMKGWLSYLDVLGKVGSAANASGFVYHWYTSKPAIDTCFAVQGTVVNPCNTCPPTVTDIDGNVYTTIKIGNQCWMAQNLKTTRYRNGSPITTGLTPNQWYSTYNGAYVLYDNNQVYNNAYGKLYNWHVVANSNGLAPAGWHIPTAAEFQQLIDSLGGNAVAGGALKSTQAWNSPNVGATNSSGFNGLPGGRGAPEGGLYLGTHGFWWSSSTHPSNQSRGYYLSLVKSSTQAEVNYDDKQIGQSIRCIKD